ncbi:class I SAM-dependent methyltransferase [Paraburkholderia panacisoli]|uniref:Class I SAM-dependent methyltransferase n=1 Tax=Paraburkholderia panacisoli TaxID=2603818 RepID=A0A5B0GZF2_9BURK|nr:class I SAM-dependent methyltransferase [Paraburkholderia panacisoli]KAA1008231.1 class I SAM-dependent methyltransferase [Paraburkholderia panacisoli]
MMEKSVTDSHSARDNQPSVVFESEPEQFVVPYDENLLERSRTQWQFGDWESLAKLDRNTLQHHPDRAKLALLAAAGRLQTNNDNATDAFQFVRLAQDWGIGRKLISQILIAGVHNSLGRAATLAGVQPRAQKHFEASVAIGTPGSAVNLVTKARVTEQIWQTKQILTEKSKNRLSAKGPERIENRGEAPATSKSNAVANPYDKAFYDAQKPGSESSANVVLSLLFKHYMPQSIVDVGCGAGTWLKVAKELGVKKILGLDGEYATQQLVIPIEDFIPHDLSAKIDKRGVFDLAMSLEVAEHLDKSRADEFVEDLCGLSDVILFSAAVPHQGGTDHRNENWPEYWAEKFQRRGFVPLDFIREKVWNNRAVEWWYRQNVLVFVRQSSIVDKFPGQQSADPDCLARIHPELFIKRAERR